MKFCDYAVYELKSIFLIRFIVCFISCALQLKPVIIILSGLVFFQNKELPSKDKFTSYTPEQVSVRGMILESQGQSGRGLRY